MRSSALAGFLASAVLVSGSAGFASTFLVGPYLGDQVRHQGRAGLMSSAAPVDPLAVLQIPAASAATASAEGEPPASQPARHLRPVENNNAPIQTAVATTVPAPASTPAVASTDMPGPISEEAFAATAPNTMPVSAGGPLIATETSTAMVAAKLENGEPVLTLRIAPVVAPTAATVDTNNPDDAVEPTVMSAPPTEQALATPAASMTPAPEPVAEPVAPPPAPAPAKPRKPAAAALQEPAPAPVEPTRRATTKPKPAPARVTTTAAPATARHIEEEPMAPPSPPPAPDPLNAPYTPSASPTLGNEEPSSAPATGAPAPMAPPPESTGGPTPLTMPQ